jgi:uncharacterized protein involved in outer membrane biogenesis
MKKIIKWFLILVIILVLAAVVGVHFFLDDAVKRGVVTIGPRLTKTEIKLDSVSLSLLNGSGKLSGLVVGNPEGYKSASAIQVGRTSIALEPKSILTDKIVISTINVIEPEVTLETDLRANNLSKILANLEETTGGSSNPESTQPKDPAAQSKKKLQVNDFLISGGKLHVVVTSMGSRTASVKLPEIHLKDLGTGPDGITPAELTKRVIQELEKAAVNAATAAIADLSKGGVYMSQDFGKAGSNNLDKAAKGIGDLFKKKQ